MKKEECASCGSTGWKPTRRDLVLGAAGALALEASLPGGGAQQQPTLCDELLAACIRNNCEPLTNPTRRSLCHLKCHIEYEICEMRRLANRISEAAEAAADWIRSHPGVVAGTIVVVLGITFVIVTGGAGAPVALFV